VPTVSNICVQPHNPSKGYTRDSPCGGIELPCLTCNNIKAEFESGSQLKLYKSKDSSSCSKYNKPSVNQGCKDACLIQFNSCISTYAASCKSKKGGYSHSKISYSKASWGDNENDKRTYGYSGEGGNNNDDGDDYDTASKKCKYQYNDCLSVNVNVKLSGSRCANWNAGWS
jgi:transcription elongation factor